MVELASVVAGIAVRAGTSFALAKLKQVFSENDRAVLAKWDELEAEFWGEVNDRLRDHEARLTAAEARMLELRLTHHEAWGVIRNFAIEAKREAMDERRRMLAHATAAIANMALDLGELARAERVLRELDPNDIRTLRGLWMVREALAGPKHPGRIRYELWQAQLADALVASGCVLIEYANVLGTETERVRVTQTGLTALRAMRTYTATRPPPFEVPGHTRTPEFRSEAEARAMLTAVPELVGACSRARGPGFDFKHLQFDPAGVAAEAAPRAKAQLVFRHMPLADARSIANASADEIAGAPHGQPVDRIAIAITSTTTDELHACVHVTGPHDVLCVLADDLDAPWA